MENKKKERILDAAFERFKHFGFLKTTVDEIAKQAQVGKGTIYSYFSNKEEILVALVDREFKKGFTIIVEAMAQEQNTIGKLRKMLQTSFDYFHKNKLVIKVMAMDPGLVLSVITEKNREYQNLGIAGKNPY
jgi:TetR/AcrR family transcriptional regulator